MKQCTNCLEYKEVIEFNYNRTTIDRLTTACKGCISVYNKAYRAANKGRLQEKDRQYSEKNADIAKERTRLWNIHNRARKLKTDKDRYEKFKAADRLVEYYGKVDTQRNKERAKLWRLTNPGKVNAQIAKRRADTIKATPGWAEYDKIVTLYEEAKQLTKSTGIDHEVDHRVPLNSPLVCGLHCMDNLQILTAIDNNKKKCKFDEDIT